jgi:hypothetical protein
VAQRISPHKMSVIIKKSQVIFVPSEAAHGGRSKHHRKQAQMVLQFWSLNS